LVGATPFWQQMGLLIGCHGLDAGHRTNPESNEQGLGKISAHANPREYSILARGSESRARHLHYQGKNYVLINALGSHEVPDGEYLYNPAANQIEYQWAQGIGSDKAPAPQAR